MQGNVFIDTNILVYGFLSNEKEKHRKVFELLNQLRKSFVIISVQVMGEIYSALSKNKVSEESIENYLSDIESQFNVVSISLDTVKRGLILKKKLHFSYWDSRIVSSALESDCSVLFSEDFSHGQMIEKKLKIQNPFLAH